MAKAGKKSSTSAPRTPAAHPLSAVFEIEGGSLGHGEHRRAGIISVRLASLRLDQMAAAPDCPEEIAAASAG